MVALPAFKFIFLAVRQVTRPVVKQIVGRATGKRGLTYSVCIGLGRVSLGVSGVIGEWSRAEERKRLENLKSEEAAKAQTAAGAAADPAAVAAAAVAAVSGSAAAGGSPTVSPETTHMKKERLTVADGPPPAAEGSVAREPSRTSASAASTTAEAEPRHVVTFSVLPRTVTPRSRSLLEPIRFGPKLEVNEGYDPTVFLKPDRSAGEVMRVFIRNPGQSAWFVFRAAFLAPFPEKRLVDAGAEFLVELLAYTILATLLFLEMRQASRAAAAKEAHVNARLEAIEEKINELVRTSSGAARSNVGELAPTPALHIKGRLESLSYLARSTYRAAEGVLAGPLAGLGLVSASATASGSGGRRGQTHEGERAAAVAAGAVVAPVYDGKSRIPKAPPPDPQVKKSKHDETAVMKEELARAMRSNRRED